MIAKTKRQKKRKSREDVIFQVFFLGLILFFVGFLAVSNYRVSKRRAELEAKIDSFRTQIQELEEKKQNLEAGISQTEKESYWEEKVREQGYVKEGEEQVVVLGPEQGQVEESKANKAFLAGFFEKIKSLLARVIQW